MVALISDLFADLVTSNIYLLNCALAVDFSVITGFLIRFKSTPNPKC